MCAVHSAEYRLTPPIIHSIIFRSILGSSGVLRVLLDIPMMGEELAIDPVLIFMVLSVLGNVVACMRVFCVRRPQERGGTTPPKRERARADEPGDAVKAKLMKCTRDQLEQLAYAVGYTKDSSKITKTVLMEMILAKGGGQSEEDQARWVHDMLLGIE